MDFALTDEQELLLESVREFCDRYFTEDIVKQMYETHSMPDEIAEAYRDAGFGLMGIPEEYGGIPADRVTIGLMIEELYRRAGCMHILYQNSLSMFDIMEFGTEAQKQEAMEHYMETGWPIALALHLRAGGGFRQPLHDDGRQEAGRRNLQAVRSEDLGDDGRRAALHDRHREGRGFPPMTTAA